MTYLRNNTYLPWLACLRNNNYMPWLTYLRNNTYMPYCPGWPQLELTMARATAAVAGWVFVWFRPRTPPGLIKAVKSLSADPPHKQAARAHCRSTTHPRQAHLLALHHGPALVGLGHCCRGSQLVPHHGPQPRSLRLKLRGGGGVTLRGRPEERHVLLTLGEMEHVLRGEGGGVHTSEACGVEGGGTMHKARKAGEAKCTRHARQRARVGGALTVAYTVSAVGMIQYSFQIP